MNICKCVSHSINIDPESNFCDVCYWKNKYDKVKEMMEVYKDIDDILYTIIRMFNENQTHRSIKIYLKHQLEFFQEKYKDKDWEEIIK